MHFGFNPFSELSPPVLVATRWKCQRGPVYHPLDHLRIHVGEHPWMADDQVRYASPAVPQPESSQQIRHGLTHHFVARRSPRRSRRRDRTLAYFIVLRMSRWPRWSLTSSSSAISLMTVPHVCRRT